jgi:FAD/FMN-containing dehydrogenase
VNRPSLRPAHGEDALSARFAAIVRPEHVLVSDDLCASYETDWTRRFHGRARLVVRPGSPAEVAAVVEACAAEGLAIVPQGGNTGLVGGSVPRAGEVVMSLVRLSRIEAVDRLAGHVVAGAGATIAALQQHARRAGLDYPVDLASRDSATVGGTIATNAGGIRVLRYGSTRAQVVGLEAVLADGSLVSRMEGLAKDNSGYDLPGLLTGSEGTLGVVTRAVLRLAPLLERRAVALLALGGTGSALEVAARLRAHLPSLEAVEVFYEGGLDLVCAHTGSARPFARPYPCYLVVECAAHDDPADGLAAVLASAPGIIESAFASDPVRQRALWRYREAHTEAISAAGVPHKLDVTLPLGRLEQFAHEAPGAVHEAHPGARVILFGHLADGNLHVNTLGPGPEEDAADDAVLRLVARLGGSISSEHGIGVAKARWLHLTRSPADIAAMRAIKAALDPRGLLNPGVIFAGGPAAAPSGAAAAG